MEQVLAIRLPYEAGIGELEAADGTLLDLEIVFFADEPPVFGPEHCVFLKLTHDVDERGLLGLYILYGLLYPLSNRIMLLFFQLLHDAIVQVISYRYSPMLVYDG